MDQTYYYESDSAFNGEFGDEYYYSDDFENSDFPHHGYTNNNTPGHWNSSNSPDVYYYDDEDYPIDEEAEKIRYVEPAILLLICLVGLVGNGLVIFVIVRQVTMRKVTYLYLTNLAVVNVFYLLTCNPVSAISYAIANWPFGAVACKLNGYLTSVCMSVIVFTLMATGLDRYLAVLHPVRSRTLRTERKAMLVICMIWVISFLLMIPRLFLFDVLEFFHRDTYMLCSRLSVHLTTRRIDSVTLLLTMYVLPQLVLGFSHLKIGLLLWQSRRPGMETQEVSLLALRERRRIAKIVFAITVAFGVGWLPIHVVNIYEDFSENGASVFSSGNRAMLILGFSFGANAINPILYCLLSKHFRSHFKHALTCWKANNRNSVQQQVTNVVAFQRQNEEVVIIDLENDSDGRNGNDNEDDCNLNVDTDRDASAQAGTIIVEEACSTDNPSSNRYLHDSKHKKTSYAQITPSYADSGHDSDTDVKVAASSKSKPLKKDTVVFTEGGSQHPLPHAV